MTRWLLRDSNHLAINFQIVNLLFVRLPTFENLNKFGNSLIIVARYGDTVALGIIITVF